MRTVLTLLGAAVLLAGASGCGGGEAGAQGRTQVVASVYPLAFLAEEIGGASVSVSNLTPPGVEPHDLELPPRDVARLRDADLVLYLGGGFQPGVEDAIRESGVRAVDVLPAGAEDPHVWLDPGRFAELAVEVSRALTGSGAAAAVVAHRLEDLDAQYRAGLADCDRREIVVSHAAFGSLARAYGLEQVALAGISPEAEATPRDLADAIETVEATGATTVFVEPLAPSREASTVARETGARLETLDPIEGLTGEELAAGEDYVTRMEANLQALRKALGCR